MLSWHYGSFRQCSCLILALCGWGPCFFQLWDTKVHVFTSFFSSRISAGTDRWWPCSCYVSVSYYVHWACWFRRPCFFGVLYPLCLFLPPFTWGSLSSEERNLVTITFRALCFLSPHICCILSSCRSPYFFPSALGRSFSENGLMMLWSMQWI